MYNKINDANIKSMMLKNNLENVHVTILILTPNSNVAGIQMSQRYFEILQK
jgi:hypothetical protein